MISLRGNLPELIICQDWEKQQKKKVTLEGDEIRIEAYDEMEAIVIWHTFTLQCVDRSNMELWDAYDGQGNKTGGELIRGQEIPEGTRRR